MTTTHAETHLDIFAALTESLEQSPPCDIGRTGNPPPEVHPCQNPADYSCRVHQCGMPDGVLLLLCDGHLEGITGRITELLQAHPAGFAEVCGHPVRRVEDFIWNITPLR